MHSHDRNKFFKVFIMRLYIFKIKIKESVNKRGCSWALSWLVTTCPLEKLIHFLLIIVRSLMLLHRIQNTKFTLSTEYKCSQHWILSTYIQCWVHSVSTQIHSIHRIAENLKHSCQSLCIYTKFSMWPTWSHSRDVNATAFPIAYWVAKTHTTLIISALDWLNLMEAV